MSSGQAEIICVGSFGAMIGRTRNGPMAGNRDRPANLGASQGFGDGAARQSIKRLTRGGLDFSHERRNRDIRFVSGERGQASYVECEAVSATAYGDAFEHTILADSASDTCKLGSVCLESLPWQSAEYRLRLHCPDGSTREFGGRGTIAAARDKARAVYGCPVAKCPETQPRAKRGEST